MTNLKNKLTNTLVISAAAFGFIAAPIAASATAAFEEGTVVAQRGPQTELSAKRIQEQYDAAVERAQKEEEPAKREAMIAAAKAKYEKAMAQLAKQSENTAKAAEKKDEKKPETPHKS